MIFQNLKPLEWLTDSGLTENGQHAREAYTGFCKYLDSLNLLSYQTARAKYFLQVFHYWTMENGYALPPHTINVNVNNVCNLGCRYCDFGQHQSETFYHKYNVIDSSKRIEMPLETAKAIVDQSKWFRPIIRVSFREALLYSHLLAFIEYAKHYGLPFWLLTNGTRLPAFAKDFVKFGVDSIRLSLDGDEETHDKIRGVAGSYRKMMDGVKMLIEERKKQQPPSSMQVGFYFTLNDWNYDKVYASLEALEKEIDLREVFINFQWLLYTTSEVAAEHNANDAAICGGYIDQSTVQNVDIYKIDLKYLNTQMEEIKQKYPASQGYRIHFRPSFDYEDLVRYRDTDTFPVEKPRCKVPWYNMNINPAGEVKTFHHCLLPPVGNIIKEPFMDVWNGEAIRDQRMKLQEHGAYRGCVRCWGVYSLLEDKKRED